MPPTKVQILQEFKREFDQNKHKTIARLGKPRFEANGGDSVFAEGVWTCWGEKGTLFVLFKQDFLTRTTISLYEQKGGDMALALYLRKCYKDACLEHVLPGLSLKSPESLPAPTFSSLLTTPNPSITGPSPNAVQTVVYPKVEQESKATERERKERKRAIALAKSSFVEARTAWTIIQHSLSPRFARLLTALQGLVRAYTTLETLEDTSELAFVREAHSWFKETLLAALSNKDVGPVGGIVGAAAGGLGSLILGLEIKKPKESQKSLRNTNGEYKAWLLCNACLL